MRKLVLAAFLCLTLTAYPLRSNACTDFLVTASDGTKVVGRSMEWGLNLKSNVCSYGKQMARTSTTPANKPGLSWKSKYGYVCLDANNMPLAIDGMNESGLSMGQLWLPGTVYQSVSESQSEQALNMLDLGHWILGNFATVDEVRSAISKVRVWSPSLPEWGGVPTAHVALHDASGKSLVIEFVNGEQKIYDNPVKVLTNAPTFDWHLTNLNNYLKISAANAEPLKINGTVLAPPGQGGGFLGIPGDWTPPSRFVRTCAMLNFAKKPKDATESVSLATHLLNAVDIPLGDVRTPDNGLDHSDYTQWVLIKDLSNRILYFRSYDNLNLRSIDLKRLDFSQGKEQKLTAVAGGEVAADITSTVLKH